MSTTRGTERTEMVERIRDTYGRLAQHVLDGAPGRCHDGDPGDPVTDDIYTDAESEAVPRAAAQASLGCGNPTALIDLHDGDVVLDLGSGGGIDVLLSARRVAPTGFAYGLDMTDEMLELARRNQAEAGLENVEFLKGRMEAIPLPDASVDVVISNCVINLSPDKAQVANEAFRVLRPGGRFAVSDVVVFGTLDEEVRRGAESRIGCVAGALGDREYRAVLGEAGFVEIEIEVTRTYELSSADAPRAADEIVTDAVAANDGRLTAAFVRAVKPAAG